MATWHQQNAMRKAIVPYWHETKWSVVIDPPNGHTCVCRFDTNEQAQTYLNNLKKHGNDRGAYILHPMREALAIKARQVSK